MQDHRISIETPVAAWPVWIGRLAGAFRRELAYQRLVRELSGLSPELLADVRVERGDIRAFARAAVMGVPQAPSDDGPMTSIGSRDWSRIYLLRLGSN